MRYLPAIMVLLGLLAVPITQPISAQDNTDEPGKNIAPMTSFSKMFFKIANEFGQTSIVLDEDGSIQYTKIIVRENDVDVWSRTTIEIHTKATNAEFKAVVDAFAKAHAETLPPMNRDMLRNLSYVWIQAINNKQHPIGPDQRASDPFYIAYIAHINDYGDFKERVEPLVKALKEITDRLSS